MTSSTSSTLSAADYLKYAQAQMAAEAFYKFNPNGGVTLTPGETIAR